MLKYQHANAAGRDDFATRGGGCGEAILPTGDQNRVSHVHFAVNWSNGGVVEGLNTVI